MSNYCQQGNRISLVDEKAMTVHESLPVGTYGIGVNPMTEQFYLEEIDNLTVPTKRYGDNDKRAARIINTFMDRDNSTGVLLAGEKGSGKTLLAKTISVLGAEHGLPTIIINTPFAGDEFNKFIQAIETPCIVQFDEFEKTYKDRDRQNMILTLLDGIFPTRKLFVLTVNDKWGVNEHFHNRPGRLFYQFEYRGVSEEFIIEYCNDNLKNKTHIETLTRIAAVFECFNFDMLKAMVEDMNRYGESPQEVMQYLNCKPTVDRAAEYRGVLIINGKEISTHGFTDWHGAPVLKQIVASWYTDDKGKDHGIRFSADDLKRVDPKAGVFEYQNKSATLTFTKVVRTEFSYAPYLA
jgi:energy-coupling factor transporter ATP-binding protein EcfA2